jgi:hypothetical protein
MITSEKTDLIVPALSAVQAAVQKVGKGATNEFDHYDYARLEDFSIAVKKHLIENKLSIVTSVVEWEHLPDRGGKMSQWVRVKISLTVIHESGQWISNYGYGEGQDRGDKSTYKAITGARKYAMAMMFDLVTSDDPESGEQPVTVEFITSQQAFDLQQGVESVGDLGKFLKGYKIKNMAEMTVEMYPKALKAVQKKQKEAENAAN